MLYVLLNMILSLSILGLLGAAFRAFLEKKSESFKIKNSTFKITNTIFLIKKHSYDKFFVINLLRHKSAILGFESIDEMESYLKSGLYPYSIILDRDVNNNSENILIDILKKYQLYTKINLLIIPNKFHSYSDLTSPSSPSDFKTIMLSKDLVNYIQRTKPSSFKNERNNNYYYSYGSEQYKIFVTQFRGRILDILLSLTAITFGLPTYLIIGLLIKISSKGPLFICYETMDRNLKSLKFYKFRTTIFNENSKHTIKVKNFQADLLPNESRFYKLGRFLYFAQLDQLPLFYNVLTGHLSVTRTSYLPFLIFNGRFNKKPEINFLDKNEHIELWTLLWGFY